MNYKALSNAQRMQDKTTHKFHPARDIIQNVLVKEDNYDESTHRFVSSIKYKHKPKTSLSKYKCSDFHLENLIASGAVDQLSQVHMDRDTLSMTSNINQQLSKIEESLNNE